MLGTNSVEEQRIAPEVARVTPAGRAARSMATDSSTALWQKHDEFFTAKAPQDIGAPQMAPQGVGHVLENIVTNLMTPAVIDLFEMV